MPLTIVHSCDSETEINPEIIELEWSMVGDRLQERNEHQVVYLDPEKVILIGGVSRDNSVELLSLIDYSSRSLAPLNIGRESHTAVKINENRVIVIGGYTRENEKYSRTCEIYDYEANSWSLTAEMNVGRAAMGASLLPDGKIMVAGGFGERENSSFGGGRQAKGTEIEISYSLK